MEHRGEWTVSEGDPLLEVEDLFALPDGSAWIEECQGATIGSMACPATVASAFSFT